MSRVWVRLENEDLATVSEFELPAAPRVDDYLLIDGVVLKILDVTWDVDASRKQRQYDAIVQVAARAAHDY